MTTAVTNDETRANRTRRLPFDTRSPGARWLAGLLGVQLLVAGALAWQGSRDGEFAAAGPLLAFEREAVTRLTIVDGTREPAAPLALVRDAGADADVWRIETGDGDALPADATRLDGVLDTLASLEATLPVASAERSRAQLDVAEDDFQRRVTLDGAEGTLADLYVGTSPGFRRAHVREATGDAIRALELNVFDLPADRDDWLDTSLLAVPEPARIAGEGFALSRDGDEWTLDGEPPAGRVLSTEAAVALADALAELRVTGVADAADDGTAVDRSSASASADDDASDGDTSGGSDDGTNDDGALEGGDDGAQASPLVLTVTEADGTAHTLTVEQRDADAIVRRGDRDAAFALPEATRERLVELATLDALLVDAPQEGEDASDTSGTESRGGSDGDSPSG